MLGTLGKSIAHLSHHNSALQGASSPNMAQSELNYMTAVENWSNEEESEQSEDEEDNLPMQMGNSDEEVSVESTNDDMLAVTFGVPCGMILTIMCAKCKPLPQTILQGRKFASVPSHSITSRLSLDQFQLAGTKERNDCLKICCIA